MEFGLKLNVFTVSVGLGTMKNGNSGNGASRVYVTLQPSGFGNVTWRVNIPSFVLLETTW